MPGCPRAPDPPDAPKQANPKSKRGAAKGNLARQESADGDSDGGSNGNIGREVDRDGDRDSNGWGDIQTVAYSIYIHACVRCSMMAIMSTGWTRGGVGGGGRAGPDGRRG